VKKPYWMVQDCPNCGQKDEEGKYLGARMSSTEWGHNYSCCSEKCGREFLNSENHKALERQRIHIRIDLLKAELKSLEAQVKS